MTGDDLFLALALQPDDAALRAVYVDWLIEHHPLRGLHARLQQAGDEAGAEALRRAHGDSWLSQAVRRHATPGTACFRDGLLDAVRLEPMTRDEAGVLATDPCWVFVRTLERPPLSVLVDSPNVTRARLDESTLEELAGWKRTLPRLARLGVETFAIDRVAPWLLPECLPSLSHLDVYPLGARNSNPRAFRPGPDDDEQSVAAVGSGPPRPAELFSPGSWAAFFAAPLPPGLSTVEVHAGFVNLATVGRQLEGARCDVERFIVSALETEGARWSVALLRTGPGRYRRFRLVDAGVSRDDRADVEALVATAAPLERAP
ncbi:MAG: hypothetical protein SFW67_37725 [Myxococcaceae bacterium]|nr:hypothetical protein [Myxococcaceae bacterium]